MLKGYARSFLNRKGVRILIPTPTPGVLPSESSSWKSRCKKCLLGSDAILRFKKKKKSGIVKRTLNIATCYVC